MWHLLYNVVLIIAAPVILFILLVKRRCRRGLLQRFGFTLPALHSDSRPLVWVHAVSLGEAVAVAPLVKELHRRHQGHRFVVSTVTETGREVVEQRMAGVAEHLYAPLDFPWVVSRLISQLQPVLYLFVETELWPNLLRDLHQRGIPTAMVNGRLSTRSFARQQWGPVRLFYRTMIERLSLCLMQSDRDVERIIMLGANPRLARRTGNIKFDQPIPCAAKSDSVREHLRLEQGERLFVAGSTHPGEEEALVECYGRLVVSVSSAVLLLAPRHIERVEQVEAMIRARGITVQRRSAIDKVKAVAAVRPRVIILDTRGELASFYREAVVAYVGGTLVPVGGHNLLEPAVWARPVLFGPYTDHCAEIASFLLESGGGRLVNDGAELTREVIRLFEQGEACERMGRAARTVVEQNQGALEATVVAIESLLTPKGSKSENPLVGNQIPLAAKR